jgi:hypothetical protein
MSLMEENKRPKKRKSHFDLISRTQIYKNKKAIESRIQKILFSFSINQEMVVTMINNSFLNIECKEKYKTLYLNKLRCFKLSESGRI